jgi:drug/metabolite transporter (DMT)-like permease
VIATVLAGVVLREHVTRGRLAGSAIVAAGIALIALG